MDIEMMPAGSLDPAVIRQFLSDAAKAYPTEVGAPDLDDWPEKLATCATTFCVRRLDGSLVASLWAYLNDTKTCVGYISFICALPECEKGTAYRLHAAYRKKSGEQGMKRLRLEVLKSNIHAINFYERQGYCIVEDRADRNRWLLELSV